MIAAEDDGRGTFFERLHNEVSGLDAGLANFLQVFGVLFTGIFGFCDGHADVAAIGDDMAQRFQMRLQTGDANGGGAHVHTAARLAEVERDAYDANVARRQGLDSGVHGLVAARGLCVDRVVSLCHKECSTWSKLLRIERVWRSGKYWVAPP